MNRRPITLDSRAPAGLVVLLTRDPTAIEVRGFNDVRHTLSLESPPAVFQRLLDDLADLARSKPILAVVPTEGETVSRAPRGENGKFLMGLAAEVFGEDGAGGTATHKQPAVPKRQHGCVDPRCTAGWRQGLPQHGAVAAHQEHGSLWLETDPDTGATMTYTLRCSPTQAGAIEYLHAGRWLFCAEPSWSKMLLKPL